MSAFKPRNANVRNGFVRTQTTSTFKAYQNDIVLDITSYKEDKIVGVNPRDGEVYQIEIADDTKKYLASNPEARKKAEDAPYNGRVINAALKAKIPVNSRIVAERFESTAPPKKEGDNRVHTGTVYQIWRAPAPQKEKAFPGIFTVSEYDRQLVAVYSWNTEGYDVENKKMTDAFAKKLDAIHNDHRETSLYNVSKSEDDKAKYSSMNKQAFELRAGYYTKEKNEKTGAEETVFKCFNLTPVVDTQSKAPEGLTYPLPVSGKDFLEYIEDYKDYMKNATLPEGVKREDVKIQFTVGKAYRITSTGNNIKAFQIRDFGSGEFSHQGAALLNRKTYLSLEEDEVAEAHGHNYAVLGALILSSDTEDPVTGEKIPRNLVGHFFARGVRGVTTGFIGSTVDGNTVRTVLVERLKNPVDDNSATRTPVERKASAPVTKSAPPVDNAPEPDMSAPAVSHENLVEDDDDIPF
jgi:hypothetical protein